jgi:hypothetical protein
VPVEKKFPGSFGGFNAWLKNSNDDEWRYEKMRSFLYALD